MGSSWCQSYVFIIQGCVCWYSNFDQLLWRIHYEIVCLSCCSLLLRCLWIELWRQGIEWWPKSLAFACFTPKCHWEEMPVIVPMLIYVVEWSFSSWLPSIHFSLFPLPHQCHHAWSKSRYVWRVLCTLEQTHCSFVGPVVLGLWLALDTIENEFVGQWVHRSVMRSLTSTVGQWWMPSIGMWSSWCKMLVPWVRSHWGSDARCPGLHLSPATSRKVRQQFKNLSDTAMKFLFY